MRSHRNKAKYTAGEIGRVRLIKDFLPAPADLVPREENVKVTLSLSRRSLDFFKREAKKRRVPYQPHDPSTGRYLCGATGREGSIACKEGGVKSEV
jgi:hypothetical protein